MPFKVRKTLKNRQRMFKGGKKQLIDAKLFRQFGGVYDIYNSEAVLNALTKKEGMSGENALGISSEDANKILEIAEEILNEQNVPTDDETAKLAKINSMNEQIKQIIMKYIDEENPATTEEKIGETNMLIFMLNNKTSNEYRNANATGDKEKGQKIRKLMALLQVILEVLKEVRDAAEAKIQALTSDEGKCLMTAGHPDDDDDPDAEGRTPGMYPMTEFEDDFKKGGFIVSIDTGVGDKKTVCTFDIFVKDPSKVRDNLCRICYPVVTQTNSNLAYSLVNNSFVANSLRVFLPEGKKGGEDLPMKIYGMKTSEYEELQRNGLIKEPPDEEEEDATITIPNYVSRTDDYGWNEGQSLTVGEKVLFPKTLWADPNDPAFGVVSSINIENETVILEPEEAREVVVEGPTEIAISQIMPIFVKTEDFKDKNGRTFFMYPLEEERIGQAASSDIYIRLRAFMDQGGIISLREIFDYVIQASILRNNKTSAFRQPLKIVKVEGQQNIPIASFKLTEPGKVKNLIESFTFGGEFINDLLGPIKISKMYINHPDRDQLFIDAKNFILAATDIYINHTNKQKTYSKRMPRLTEYLDNFNVISASHCQDGQTETMYKIQLSQEQQDEWDAYRKTSDKYEQIKKDEEQAKADLREINRLIKSGDINEKNEAELITGNSDANELIAKAKSVEKKRLADLRVKLNRMFRDNGSRLTAGTVPREIRYEDYKTNLTLPDAKTYYQKAITETLNQLINNSDDYKDRSVAFNPDISQLFCIPGYPRQANGTCQVLPLLEGPLRLFAAWMANQFLCLIPDPENPSEKGRHYHYDENEFNRKAVINALSFFKIIKKRATKRTDLDDFVDNEYMFWPVKFQALEEEIDERLRYKAIQVFIEGEYDSIAMDAINGDEDYIKNIIAKNYVTFTPSEPITEENCVRIVADPRNYILTELQGLPEGVETQIARDGRMYYINTNDGTTSHDGITWQEDPDAFEEDDEEEDDNCQVLGEDIPRTFDSAACSDLMCLVYHIFTEMVEEIDDANFKELADAGLVPQEIINRMIQTNSINDWLSLINRDTNVRSNEDANNQLRSMVTHIVECMLRGEECTHYDLIRNTCMSYQGQHDNNSVTRRLFDDSGDNSENRGPQPQPQPQHPMSLTNPPLGHNCFAVRDRTDFDGEVPSNWDEETCADLMCAVKDEYENIANEMTSEARERMTIEQWVNEITESWRTNGDDPVPIWVQRISNADEFKEKEDPEAAAREKLNEMISTVVDCLIEGPDCFSHDDIYNCPPPASFSDIIQRADYDNDNDNDNDNEPLGPRNSGVNIPRPPASASPDPRDLYPTGLFGADSFDRVAADAAENMPEGSIEDLSSIGSYNSQDWSQDTPSPPSTPPPPRR